MLVMVGVNNITDITLLLKHQFGQGTAVHKTTAGIHLLAEHCGRYSSAKVVLRAPLGPAMIQQVGIRQAPHGFNIVSKSI